MTQIIGKRYLALDEPNFRQYDVARYDPMTDTVWLTAINDKTVVRSVCAEALFWGVAFREVFDGEQTQ